jgi:hypothetical protein
MKKKKKNQEAQEDDLALIGINLNSLHARMIVPFLIESGQLVLEKNIFKDFSQHKYM